MGEDEIRSFISDLASKNSVAASTQTVALSALLFLYREVLKKDLPYIEGIERAKRPERVPVVFTQAEVKEVLARLDGVNYLRDAFAGERIRHPNCSRVVRPQGCAHDNDLYACFE
jgi:site-specific recombinase XerD